jgi:DNA processing protein
MAQSRATLDIRTKISTYLLKNIWVLTQSDPRYPAALRYISDPPICLYVYAQSESLIGNLSKKPIGAIVGSRKHSEYGKQMTKYIVQGFSSQNVTVVSGLALGIDAIAHISALDSHLPTIAVLGSGVDICYPPDNTHLYNRIFNTGSLIISEFAPGTPPVPGNFVARNRIVSGLSDFVVVIEGARTSGSLITAKIAADQGKDVYALPGLANSNYAEGPHDLIKQGARLITDSTDIFPHTTSARSCPVVLSDPIEQAIYTYIREHSETYIDQLVRDLYHDITTINKHISMMEIRGLIQRDITGSLHIS